MRKCPATLHTFRELLQPARARQAALAPMQARIARGETPDNVKNHPALKGLNIPRTGRSGNVGTLVTKTLVIAGEPGVFTTPNGQKGAMLRAYDKTTGKEVG